MVLMVAPSPADFSTEGLGEYCLALRRLRLHPAAGSNAARASVSNPLVKGP